MVSVKRGRRSRLSLGFSLAIALGTCSFGFFLFVPSRWASDTSGNIPEFALPFPTSGTNNLLLSVPFYVYEDLAWKSATFGRNTTVEDLSRLPRRSKHLDDFFFMKSSLVHPMRTRDPSKAKLFVIPLLMNTYFDRTYFSGKDYKLCYRHDCDRNLLYKAISTLSQSEWLQKYPERHIVVQSHYLAELYTKVPKELKEMLYQVNAISFEHSVPNRPDRLRFPKLYVGSPCPMAEKTHDVAMIASANMKKLHYFQDRINICAWILNSTSTTNTLRSIRMNACGQGRQCPALAQAKYGFHTRGDTLGSNRLLDTLLSGTIPIFTMKEQYDILPPWLDWRELSVLLPMNDGKNETQFVQALEHILQDFSGYRDRHQTVLQHRDLLDWNTLHPFDLYMYSLQAELYPETRHRTDILRHVWPALTLPSPVS
jgi:Exostosin family